MCVLVQKPGSEPGNVAPDFLNWKRYSDPEERKDKVCLLYYEVRV
jgi:hypothetical protein